MNTKLKELIERLDRWPPAAQEELAEVAFEIESEMSGAYQATPEELEAIDRGLRDAAEGRFATDEEVEAVFSQYRRS